MHRYIPEHTPTTLLRCIKCLEIQPPSFAQSIGFCKKCLDILRMPRDEWTSYQEQHGSPANFKYGFKSRILHGVSNQLMTTEEARQRIKLCHGHIKPRQIENQWVCDNCGVSLARSPKHKIGWRHFIIIENKTCNKCNETKELEHFYERPDSVDGYSGYCRGCRNVRQEELRENLGAGGQFLRVWLPRDLVWAMNKVRGRQTIRDFFVQAVRREVEIRTRDIMTQQALASIGKKKAS